MSQPFDLDGRLKKYISNRSIIDYADEMLDPPATNFAHANISVEDVIVDDFRAHNKIILIFSC